MSANIEALASILREEGAGPGNSIHSWRCEYPDRYDPCRCVEEVAQEILASGWYAAVIATAKHEERERIADLINDAALHVMATADSNVGATLTANILERAAGIAREGAL